MLVAAPVPQDLGKVTTGFCISKKQLRVVEAPVQPAVTLLDLEKFPSASYSLKFVFTGAPPALILCNLRKVPVHSVASELRLLMPLAQASPKFFLRVLEKVSFTSHCFGTMTSSATLDVTCACPERHKDSTLSQSYYQDYGSFSSQCQQGSTLMGWRAHTFGSHVHCKVIQLPLQPVQFRLSRCSQTLLTQVKAKDITQRLHFRTHV